MNLERAKTPVDEQRKLVTILFADVYGFAAIAQKMDARSVKAMMDTL